MTDGVLMFNKNNQIKTANPAALKIFGKELNDLNLKELFSSEILELQKTSGSKITSIFHNNREIILEINFPKPNSRSCIIKDITEQQHVIANFREMAEKANTFYYEVRDNNIVFETNDSEYQELCQKILGRTIEEFNENKNPTAIYASKDHEKFNDYLQRVLSREKNVAPIEIGVLVDEKEKPFLFRCELTKNGHRGFLTDLSNLKKMQEMEKIVKQITEELLNAIKKADKANLAKSEFLANMSHEIRTPLNAINILLDSIFNSDLNEEQKKIIITALSASDLLKKIINDLLDLSKIEAGKLEIENIPFDLFKLIKNIKSMAEKNIKFQIDNNIPQYLTGDPTRLQQILLNLITNANKFKRENVVSDIRINMKIDTEIKETEKTQLIFEIIDNGIGINEITLEKLFTNFTQADSSTTRKYGGTGLGLSICKNLIKLMDSKNGKIWVESEVGQGSVFSFTIGFPTSTAEAVNLQKSTGNIESLSFVEEIKILVVEDSLVNQFAMAELLKKRGAKIDDTNLAKNGIEAIEKFQKALTDNQPFDLILMDLQMPEMDGKTVTAEIRKEEQLAEKKTIIFGFSADTSLGAWGENSGIDDSITKPLDLKDFYKKLLEHLPKKVRVVLKTNLIIEEFETTPSPESTTDYYLNAMEKKGFHNKKDALLSLSDIIPIYLEDMNQNINEIKILTAKENLNLKIIFEITHNLKGQTYNMGFDDLGKLIADINELVRPANKNESKEFDITEIKKFLAQLEADWEKTKTALEKILAENTTTIN